MTTAQMLNEIIVSFYHSCSEWEKIPPDFFQPSWFGVENCNFSKKYGVPLSCGELEFSILFKDCNIEINNARYRVLSKRGEVGGFYILDSMGVIYGLDSLEGVVDIYIVNSGIEKFLLCEYAANALFDRIIHSFSTGENKRYSKSLSLLLQKVDPHMLKENDSYWNGRIQGALCGL